MMSSWASTTHAILARFQCWHFCASLFPTDFLLSSPRSSSLSEHLHLLASLFLTPSSHPRLPPFRAPSSFHISFLHRFSSSLNYLPVFPTFRAPSFSRIFGIHLDKSLPHAHGFKVCILFFRLGIVEKDPSDLLKLYLLKHGKVGKRDGTVGIFSIRFKILPTVLAISLLPRVTAYWTKTLL